jgi:class 3 adenylate cyclase
MPATAAATPAIGTAAGAGGRLLADRDPEEARKRLDPVLERMMEAVHRYEGTVNQVMGDGIMGLFGTPLAREDHVFQRHSVALASSASTARRVARFVCRWSY